MSYVDGFVLIVPKKNIDAYKAMATGGRDLWKKHGALDYKECVGDDLRPEMPDMPGMAGMKPWNFPDMLKLKDDETAVFSYIVFRDRAHRDKVNAKVMSDPSMKDPTNKNEPMPFDMRKMAYGGFETIVE